MCKAELLGDKCGYLSEQSFEDRASFIHVDCSQVREERGKLREKLVSKKESGFDNLGNSHLTRLLKMLTLGDSLSENKALERKPGVC